MRIGTRDLTLYMSYMRVKVRDAWARVFLLLLVCHDVFVADRASCLLSKQKGLVSLGVSQYSYARRSFHRRFSRRVNDSVN